MQNQNDKRGADSDKEIYYVDNANSANGPSSEANYMDDLTPPAINFGRDSILFSENPATKQNDALINFWKSCKTNLPAVLTGARSWRSTEVADGNPIGAIYNMVFVRMPVIGVTVVYIQNLLHGHPLVMDIGQGPFEVGPFIVLSVLAFILA